MISEFNSKIIKYLCLLVFLQACAYFNTFYNAEEHYSNAEKLRIQSLGSSLPAKAIQEYGKAIEKSDKVLSDYSDSDYVKDAMLLKGKSHFFRREYDSAKEVFTQLQDSEEQFFVDETRYWLALCKWKDLKPQPAINDLKNLLSDTDSVDLKSRIYLVLGEIYLANEDSDNAFHFLNLGAETSKDRLTREQIYFQIAELSYDKKIYEQALDSYKKVLNNSVSINRIRESNLKIIQTYRLLGQIEQSKSRIEKLLLNDDFSSIKADLRLELIKIELNQGNVAFAIESLDIIAQDYVNTKIAIEAYYILSTLYLESPNLDFEKSNFFMNEAMKQNANSSHKVLISNKRDAVANLVKLDQLLKEDDTVDKSDTFYRLGEILAFDLGNLNDSINYFENIVNNFEESSVFPSATFALYSIYNTQNNSRASKYKDTILSLYPDSDFAKFIIKDQNLNTSHKPSEMLLEAESLWSKNSDEALKIYRSILNIDSSTESSNIAAYFLGYYYDYELSDSDSAIVYYQWLASNHPDSKQGELAQKRLENLNVQ
jgi:predicted negative regulator of RcsB-dependent stress response|tara:strand:- start:739 stop:2364 length:1626 start_codon:yes stop_codon:yes gene_type:complete